MKTTTYLLMTLLLLAGSQTDLQAENNRKDKKEQVEVRTKTVRENKVSNREKRSAVKSPENKNQKRTVKRSTAVIRNERKNADRNERNNERTEIRSDNKRAAASNRSEVRTDNEQNRNDSRSNIRFRTDRGRYTNVHYRRHEQRCRHCSGHGFTLHLDGFTHISCMHCSGIGFRILRGLYLDDDWNYTNYNLEELAVLETNCLNEFLELSDRQWDKVFRINYRYLLHRERRDYYPVAHRDREIRNVLHLGQRIDYALYLDDLRHGDLSYERNQ